MPISLTDQGYWDNVWTFTDDHGEPPSIDDERDTHQAFLDRLLGSWLAPGKRFLEIGSGGSAWPAHVASKYGAEAWGIDFSRTGQQIAHACGRRERVRLELIEGDFFDKELLPARAFDVVYSGGFVEHFPEAEPLMKRIAELLAPGGVVITSVPNLDGLNGTLQRLTDRDCYDRHIVFTRESLDAAHALGGLEPLMPAQFFGVFDPGSINFSRIGGRLPDLALKLIWAGLTQSRRAGEWIARRLGAGHGGRVFSPGLIGVYGSAGA